MPTLSPSHATVVTSAGSTEILDGPRYLGEASGEISVERLDPGSYLIVDAGETPRVYALTQEVTRIGRALAAELRLDEHTVSARHAIVARRPGGMRLLDDRSTNGTYVNGTRVDQADLASGDVIAVGRVVLSYLEVAD